MPGRTVIAVAGAPVRWPAWTIRTSFPGARRGSCPWTPTTRCCCYTDSIPPRPLTCSGSPSAGVSILVQSPAAAAARELLEEAGLAVDPADLGEPVWHRIAEFGFDGRRYRQEEDYFLLRVESFEVSLAGLDTIEQETVVGYRWWDADAPWRPPARRSSQPSCHGCYASWKADDMVRPGAPNISLRAMSERCYHGMEYRSILAA